jgi:hypothetical protein
LVAPKIQGELQKLGFVVSETSVGRYFISEAFDDVGIRAKQRPTFLVNHREVIAAFDFFTVPTATLRLQSVVQQLREALPEARPYR